MAGIGVQRVARALHLHNHLLPFHGEIGALPSSQASGLCALGLQGWAPEPGSESLYAHISPSGAVLGQ